MNLSTTMSIDNINCRWPKRIKARDYQVKKKTTFCVWEAYFKYKNLNVKRMENIYNVNTEQKKDVVAMLTSRCRARKITKGKGGFIHNAIYR